MANASPLSGGTKAAEGGRMGADLPQDEDSARELSTNGSLPTGHPAWPGERQKALLTKRWRAPRGPRQRWSFLRGRPSTTSSFMVPPGSHALMPKQTPPIRGADTTTSAGATKPSTMLGISQHGDTAPRISSGELARPSSMTRKSVGDGAGGKATVWNSAAEQNLHHSLMRRGVSDVSATATSRKSSCGGSALHLAAYTSQTRYPVCLSGNTRERPCLGRLRVSLAS